LTPIAAKNYFDVDYSVSIYTAIPPNFWHDFTKCAHCNDLPPDYMLDSYVILPRAIPEYLRLDI